MTHGRRRFRALLFLGVGLAASALALAALRLHVVQGLELNSADLRFDVRGTQAPPQNVVLVQVDDKTLSDLRMRWPYRRTVHARLIDRLRADGAKVIAFDVLFDAPTKDDDALVRAVARAGNVVLAATQTDGHGLVDLFGGAYPEKFGARAGTLSTEGLQSCVVCDRWRPRRQFRGAPDADQSRRAPPAPLMG